MDAKLVVTRGRATHEKIRLRLPTIVGRDQSAGLIVGHPTVSRKHCELFELHGALVLRDFGSSNGSYVGEERVKGEALIRPGDEFTIGPLTFRAEYQTDLELTSLDDLKSGKIRKKAKKKKPKPIPVVDPAIEFEAADTQPLDVNPATLDPAAESPAAPESDDDLGFELHEPSASKKGPRPALIPQHEEPPEDQSAADDTVHAVRKAMLPTEEQIPIDRHAPSDSSEFPPIVFDEPEEGPLFGAPDLSGLGESAFEEPVVEPPAAFEPEAVEEPAAEEPDVEALWTPDEADAANLPESAASEEEATPVVVPFSPTDLPPAADPPRTDIHSTLSFGTKGFDPRGTVGIPDNQPPEPEVPAEDIAATVAFEHATVDEEAFDPQATVDYNAPSERADELESAEPEPPQVPNLGVPDFSAGVSSGAIKPSIGKSAKPSKPAKPAKLGLFARLFGKKPKAVTPAKPVVAASAAPQFDLPTQLDPVEPLDGPTFESSPEPEFAGFVEPGAAEEPALVFDPQQMFDDAPPPNFPGLDEPTEMFEPMPDEPILDEPMPDEPPVSELPPPEPEKKKPSAFSFGALSKASIKPQPSETPAAPQPPMTPQPVIPPAAAVPVAAPPSSEPAKPVRPHDDDLNDFFNSLGLK